MARIAFEAPEKNVRTLRLAGSCLTAGPWAVMILSRGDAFAVTAASVTPAEPGAPTLVCPD